MFKDILGNEENKLVLEKIIETKNISHSYMFVGKEGIGKLLFAKEFANMILNSSISLENNPDFSIIEPDGNTIKINQIREFTKKVYEKPISSEKKVFIINNSECMTKEAQNALLKTLEEPPHYIVIILIAKNKDLFLPTIKSRCTEVIFKRLNDEDVLKILKEKYNLEVDQTILKIADGSIEKALNLLEDNCNYDKIDKVFSNLESISKLDILNCKEEIFENKDNVFDILEYINILILDKIKENDKRYLGCIEIVEDAKQRLKRNNNYDMTIDDMNLKLWEEINGKHNRS